MTRSRTGRVPAADITCGIGLGADAATRREASEAEQPCEAGLSQLVGEGVLDLPFSVDGSSRQTSGEATAGDIQGERVRELVQSSSSCGTPLIGADGDGCDVWALRDHRRKQYQGGWWRRWLLLLLSFLEGKVDDGVRDRLRFHRDHGQGRSAEGGQCGSGVGGAICRTSLSAGAVQASNSSGQLSRRRRRSRRGAPSKRRRARECRTAERAEGVLLDEARPTGQRETTQTAVAAVRAVSNVEVEKGSSQFDKLELCTYSSSDSAEGEDGAGESLGDVEGRTISEIERGWHGPWAKRHGALEAHVRFLQWVFRTTRAAKAECWKAGSLRVPYMMASAWGRRQVVTRCAGGAGLATDAEFAAQRKLGEEMLDWYSIYPALLRRLESGITPFCIQNFCGGGGASEGCRRAGGACHGLDAYEQPDYCRRFGAEAFTKADGMSWSTVKGLRDQKQADFLMGGPPCKFYSRARVRGEATQPPLIGGFRDQCQALFGQRRQWAIENVMGAEKHMSPDAQVLDGAYFGLKVARARLYETSGKLHVDTCVRDPADALAAKCCLGRRRRFRRFDEFGRPVFAPCCSGNIFSVVGKTPWKCTAEECTAAMGMDPGHMGYERLAQSVPPHYAQLVFSQMCMWQAAEKFGVPAITFDEHRARPSQSMRTLAFWLRGAGASEATLGQLFQPAPEVAIEPAGTARAEMHVGEGCTRVAEFRELFYSHAGFYDQQWVSSDLSGRLTQVSRGVTLSSEPNVAAFIGYNSYVEIECEIASSRLARAAAAAVSEGGSGTRATFVVRLSQRAQLEELGFEYLACSVGAKGPDALWYKGLVALRIGRRAGVTKPSRLCHEDVRAHMDWRDQGGYETDPVKKAQLTWEGFPHDPERYRGKGLPAWVERMMVDGAEVDMDSQVVARDYQQYMWPDGVALTEAIMETERHLAIGALEFVPDDEVEQVLREQVVHPILLVAQGKGKFRACHDYSRGTNRKARSAPFALPSVWDARGVVKPSSYFVKYDLRDGFFAIPVHPQSRNRLVVRHPATGRLLRCARLPFGYVDSPRLFCGLTEAIADEVRRRTVGMGVHVFVFVDDFLCVGDDAESARLAGETLEEVLYEFGIPWAPHKQRGPARCMEFLGLLLSNVPGHRCVALTEKRQQKLRDQINHWRAMEPGRVGIGKGSGASVVADVHELASFLGHLVFCSQVVPQGRTYMQGMLSQFAGLEVDWRRGEVRATGGGKRWAQGIELQPGFWRDLAWWDERLEHRNSTPMDMPARGEVAVCGTDASDWGTGQLLWGDGRRAETVLRFSLAERARSINWRELLGIVRVVEQFGEELRGRSLLVEGDNTSSIAAASNESSKAEDSQELVRRLVELIERYDLSVRFTHTPGVKLDRPDQTSRGDPIEEPRVRIRRDAYDLLERGHGPFTEWLGAERRFAVGKADGGEARIWMHPAHATVGSALRRLGERIGDGGVTSGVVVVPHDERARWWPLTKHFRVIGRWPEGSDHLEANRVGKWVQTCSTRAALILAFPRVGSVRPVLGGDGARDGYVEFADVVGKFALPLSAGAFVYSAGEGGQGGGPGELYQLWRDFDPGVAGQVEFGGEEPLVRTAELLRSDARADGRHPMKYSLDVRGPGKGSFAGAQCMPWAVDARMLFEVGHLVRVLQQPESGKTKGGKLLWSKAKELSVEFNWHEAEIEIESVMTGKETNIDLAEVLCGDVEDGDAADALARARASASEAAAARNRPPPHAPRAREVAGRGDGPGDGDMGAHRCRYSEMSCEGCHGRIGWGKPMRAGGRGMVHADGACKKLADEALVKSNAQAPKIGEIVSGTGSLKRQVQAEHRVSAERVQNAMRCLEGRCSAAALEAEPKMMCIKGCGRGVHGVSCCGFSSGVVQLGNLTCAYCRAEALLTESCTPPERLITRMAEPMLVEAATGAANTHKGYSDLAALERRWQADIAGESLSARDVRLPHTSAEGCYAFVLWLARDGGRARSLGTTLRQMSGFCAKLDIPNHASSKRVKALVKDLETKGEAITEPDTQVTTLMIAEMYGPGGTIASECSKREVMARVMTVRETVLNDMELVGGHRVGEVCGGGDGHGMMANKVCIQKIVSGQGSEYGETIEARIEDSKTGFSRWTVFAGTTETSKIEVSNHLREWWEVCGFKVIKKQVGAFWEERPDYWVVRVSLLDMSVEVYRAFMEAVEWSTDRVIMRDRKNTLKYAKERRTSKTLGEEMRYVNVTGGERMGENVSSAVEWLTEHGFGRYTNVTEGPLIRVTNGYALTHMPYSPKSTHVHLIPAMEAAFARVQESGAVDPEYDSTTDPVPKFGNHSNRRHADRVAMRNAKELALEPETIDFFFGWGLKRMKEEMRLHYAGLDRLLRLGLSKVTKLV